MNLQTGQLVSYAASDAHTRGRRHPEPPPAYRSEYQRDRDRIIHSKAFRRLEYKTQVFVNYEGDLFRTRLTHTLEVAQIARSIARALQLNEDLAEAVALAHDLGHTPFGHAGQDALDACMAPYGGFEHNQQSLRVVDDLEARYAEFSGLNLTFETREGILKHCKPESARALGEIGQRFIDGAQPGLEAQIANLADEIAYNNHDVDDGLRAGLIELDDLRRVALFNDHYEIVTHSYPQLDRRRRVHETVRRMINHLVVDLIETSRSAIDAAAPADIDAVRAREAPLIGFSEATLIRNQELKRFLHRRLYRHYRVHRMGVKARRLIAELFNAFMQDPDLLPAKHAALAREEARGNGAAGCAQRVADYIAGMTDRYAIMEHKRLFDPGELT